VHPTGDINCSFFDRHGKTRRPDWEFFLKLDVDNMRKLAAHLQKEVVVIAGNYKIEPLKAALEGNLCNVLITDEQTMRDLLSDAT
jgi:deoxyribonucleoside regulator